MLLNPIFNYSEHLRHVHLHLLVLKSQEVESGRFQPTLPFEVLTKLASMTIAINFNHETQLGTIEVNDVMINGILACKLIPKHLPLL